MSSCSLAMLAKWVVAWVEVTLYMVFLPLPEVLAPKHDGGVLAEAGPS